MKNYAVIGGKKIDLEPLEAIRTLAYAKGCDDVDVEPRNDTWKVTVRGRGGLEVSAVGGSLEELCEKIVSKILAETGLT
jgi:dissimilatory sulfite reductase (desulfoviridin) alpha/beta subunit